MIDRQVTNLVRLIDDLLEISRITRGKIQLHHEHVNLLMILSHAVEAAQPAIADKRHVLSVDLAAEALPVFGDPTRLEQIFVNLLGNAVKYTDEGGMIEVSARRDGDRAVVRVRDTGIGIPPEMLRQIFEPFAQVDQSLDRSKGARNRFDAGQVACRDARGRCRGRQLGVGWAASSRSGYPFHHIRPG